MKPNRIRILSNELVNIHAICFRRTPDALLLPVDENKHELFSALSPRPLFCVEFALTFAHINSFAPRWFEHTEVISHVTAASPRHSPSLRRVATPLHH
jgi:hypothetical protein